MTDGSAPEDPQQWTQRRREAARAHADRMTQAKARETARARELIAQFVAEASRRQLTTRALLARTNDRPPIYRTGLNGWYLNRDGSLAITPDGDYYIMVTAESRLGRLRGVSLQPTDPPLQVGAGGRDGESIALTALLEMRLQAGDDWPVHGR